MEIWTYIKNTSKFCTLKVQIIPEKDLVSIGEDDTMAVLFTGW